MVPLLVPYYHATNMPPNNLKLLAGYSTRMVVVVVVVVLPQHLAPLQYEYHTIWYEKSKFHHAQVRYLFGTIALALQ